MEQQKIKQEERIPRHLFSQIGLTFLVTQLAEQSNSIPTQLDAHALMLLAS